VFYVKIFLFSKHTFSAISAPIFSSHLFLPHGVGSSAIENVLSNFFEIPPERNYGTKCHFGEIFLTLHEDFAVSFHNAKKF